MSGGVLRPGTLRVLPGVRSFDGAIESNPTQKITVGCLIAVAAMGSSAEAQEQSLPPVTVDADRASKTTRSQTIAGTDTSTQRLAPYRAREGDGRRARQG